MKPVYLDHNATTPVRPEVVEAMLPMFREEFGNPSSVHACGGGPRTRREEARARVAALLGCCPVEVVFTSGGTESDNHAIKGTAFALRDKGTHIVTSRVEHHAVLHTCRWLEQRLGFSVTYLGVDADGRVDPEAVRAAITPATVLVSIMAANNESGSINPVAAIGARLPRARRALPHRRGAGGRQDPDAGRRLGRRPAVDLGAQDLRPEGRRACSTSARASRSTR